MRALLVGTAGLAVVVLGLANPGLGPIAIAASIIGIGGAFLASRVRRIPRSTAPADIRPGSPLPGVSLATPGLAVARFLVLAIPIAVGMCSVLQLGPPGQLPPARTPPFAVGTPTPPRPSAPLLTATPPQSKPTPTPTATRPLPSATQPPLFATPPDPLVSPVPPFEAQIVTVTYSAWIETLGDAWSVHEEITVPAETVRRILDFHQSMKAGSSQPPSGPEPKDPGGLQSALDGWTVAPVDGVPIYERERRVPLSARGVFPLSATDEIALPTIEVAPLLKVRFRDGSRIVVTAPKHLIRAIDPPARLEPAAAGLEVVTVSLPSSLRPVVRIESMSDFGRTDLGRGLADFSITGIAGIAIGVATSVATALLTLAFQERLLKRRKPTVRRRRKSSAT